VHQDILTPAYLSIRKPVNNTANQQQQWAVCSHISPINYSLLNVNIMNLFFLHQPVKKRKEESAKRTLVSMKGTEHNITDGGEFLDDAIRMKDLSLAYTDNRIAEIDPEDLYDYSAE
jgi:hypothetical protein